LFLPQEIFNFANAVILVQCSN